MGLAYTNILKPSKNQTQKSSPLFIPSHQTTQTTRRNGNSFVCGNEEALVWMLGNQKFAGDNNRMGGKNTRKGRKKLKNGFEVIQLNLNL
jgi:hypothetical protein